MKNKLILGTVQFGIDYGINNKHGKPSTANALKILEFAFLNGVNTLDTADDYFNSGILKKFINQRDEIKIYSKFKFSEPATNRHSLKEKLYSTLESLGTSKIEGYSLHQPQDLKHINENEICELKREGLIKYFGISIYTNSDFRMSVNCPFIDVIQVPFNLLDNWHQKGDLLTEARKCGKIIHARSIFLQGLFFIPLTQMPERLSSLLPYLEEIKLLASREGISIEALALNYVLAKLEIEKVLIGVDSLSHLERNLEFSKIKINQKLTTLIDELQVMETELLSPANWKI